MRLPLFPTCIAAAFCAALSVVSARPVISGFEKNLADNQAAFIGGDELGSLPLVTNDGPGAIQVDLLDENGSSVASFGLDANRWREITVPVNGSVKVKDKPDPAALGSKVLID